MIKTHPGFSDFNQNTSRTSCFLYLFQNDVMKLPHIRNSSEKGFKKYFITFHSNR